MFSLYSTPEPVPRNMCTIKVKVEIDHKTKMMLNDEWLFDSIKQYKNLSMYDVQHSVTAVDIVDSRGLCVGTTSGKRHELLELLMPDKLLDMSQGGKLKKDRDFRVNCGWFSDSKVTQVKHLPNTRYCAVAEEDKRDTVTVLEMGNRDSDLMKPYRWHSSSGATTCHPVRICPARGHDSQLAFGSCLDNVTLVDIHKEETITDSTDICTHQTNPLTISPQVSVDKTCVLDCKSRDPISSLHNHNAETVVCCTNQGEIAILDTRCRKMKVASHPNGGKPASMWTLAPPFDQSNSLLQLSSSGEVLCLDSRCLDENVVSKQAAISTDSDGQYTMIQESPHHDLLSISGFDGLVYLFKQSDLQNSSESLEPVFKHAGHVMESEDQSEVALQVVQHLWHPWQLDLVISSADNGSIHAWQWSGHTP